MRISGGLPELIHPSGTPAPCSFMTASTIIPYSHLSTIQKLQLNQVFPYVSQESYCLILRPVRVGTKPQLTDAWLWRRPIRTRLKAEKATIRARTETNTVVFNFNKQSVGKSCPSFPSSQNPSRQKQQRPINMSNFLTHISPPGSSLANYNRSLPPSQQPKSGAVSQAFIDAMTVREKVFVEEQEVPLERELDSEDKNSHHWVVYASVATKTKQSIPLNQPLPAGAEGSPDTAPSEQRRRSSGVQAGSTGRRRSSTSGDGASGAGHMLPVGTIRAIPPEGVYPHSTSRRSSSPAITPTSPVHPNVPGLPSNPPAVQENPAPHPTVFPNEPYVRLGRLATLPAYRGHGISRLLISSVLDYVRKNPRAFSSTYSNLEDLTTAIQEGTTGTAPIAWKGLVVVHAQRDRTVGLWKKFGFEIDKGMEEWDEEGMIHVGMWLRVAL
jgi:predicted GNAT family N-acyltransferase